MSERQLSFDEFEDLAADVLAGGHSLRFEARGASMRPFILHRDIVEICSVSVDQLQTSEVVLCRLAGGRLVVHRVLSMGPAGLLIQGDALLHPDGWVGPENVLGRVSAVWRAGKPVRLDTPVARWLVRAWLLMTPLRGPLLRGGSLAKALFRTIQPGKAKQ